MSQHQKTEVTELLQRLTCGDETAADELLPLIYDDLRSIAKQLMRRERSNHTLQATALVHESYLKLTGKKSADWEGHHHFLAVSAIAMRRILVDHAKTRSRDKRGGKKIRLDLEDCMAISISRDEDLLSVDEALEKLSAFDPRQARIVELRFFGGLTVAETASVLGLSKRTVEGEWTIVRAWLRRELRKDIVR